MEKLTLYKVRPKLDYKVREVKEESPFVIYEHDYRRYIGVDEDEFPRDFDLIDPSLEVGCTVDLEHTSSFWEKLYSNRMGTIRIKGISQFINKYKVSDTPPPDLANGQHIFPEISAV